MKIVTLKNGSEAPEPAVMTTMITLEDFAAADPIAIFELVSVCRNPEHKVFGDYGQMLVDLAMLEGIDEQGRGRVHDIVRDIVLSAVVGDDLDMRLTSPVAR